MLKYLMALAVLVGSFATALTPPAEAGSRYEGKSRYSKSGPRVKGYVARRGGFSYDYADSINTYGDSRGRYGSANSLRDPGMDRQTNGGPFDHGFFFDSGIGMHGGESPYMN